MRKPEQSEHGLWNMDATKLEIRLYCQRLEGCQVPTTITLTRTFCLASVRHKNPENESIVEHLAAETKIANALTSTQQLYIEDQS